MGSTPIRPTEQKKDSDMERTIRRTVKAVLTTTAVVSLILLMGIDEAQPIGEMLVRLAACLGVFAASAWAAVRMDEKR